MRITERKCDCKFQMMPITEYSETSTLYYPTWEDSGVLTLVYKINIDGSTTLVDFDIRLHVIDNRPQREVYNLPNLKDGWYKVKSYILPTKDFLISLGMEDGYNDTVYQQYWEGTENAFRKGHTMTLAIDNSGIYYQGRKLNISPYTSGAYYYWVRADVVDVVDEFLTRGSENGFVYGTNVRLIEEDFFTTCYLYKCFINRAQSLLNSYRGCYGNSGICNSTLKCKDNIDDLQIQIRDYIWMTLNAIKYAIECEDYYTANNLLNCLNTCAGICNNGEEDSDCGCGKYKPLTVAKKFVNNVPDEAYEYQDINNFYNKKEIIALLNQKQDKLTAGLDINITDDNVINNQHRSFSNNDINNLWNG